MAAHLGPTGAETLGEVIHQVAGAAGVHIENTQLLHTFRQQRMRHRRARTAGTHLHHALACHILQVASKAFGEPQAIGVVADALAVLEHHGVDRANAAGLVGQFIEQR